MKLHIRMKSLCILIMLAILLPFSGTANATNEGAQASLASPSAHQVYKPGDIVEISGTAQKVTEVTLAVRNPQGGLLYAAQPKVLNNSFTSSFTLEPQAAEGKYSILVGGLGLQVKSYSFTVSEAGGAAIELTKPSADASFKPGDIVEIAGTGQKVNSVAVCVRNSNNGRVYVGQPSVVDGKFTTRFTLPANAVAGKYNIAITAAGLAGAKNYSFSATSPTGGGPVEPEPKKDAILFINGNGVAKKVSYTRAELEAMNQQSEVLSATSDYPEDLVVAVEGVPLRTLLEEAGINWGSAQKITFSGSDGYTAEFTINELFYQKRYIFPGRSEVEPIIALKRAERSSSFGDMSTQDTPVMVYGQRAQTEQTLLWFVKRLTTINVSTSSPGTWTKPEAKIITPDSKQKVATQGGEVKSGSQVYLYCSDPVAKIYYTTDGSTPDMNSKIFNLHGCGPLVGKDDPILVDKTTTVKAMAIGRGKQNSEVASFTFTVAGTTTDPAKPTILDNVVQQPVDEKNIKKEEQELEEGRKGEKLTLQAGVMEDIETGEPGSRLVISSTGDVDEVTTVVPASVLQKAQGKSMLLGINSQIGNYTLPLANLNLAEIAAGLNAKPEELTFNIIISKAPDKIKNKLLGKVQEGQEMQADPVEFRLEITTPDGKKIEYKSFANMYIERNIPLTGDVNVNQATGVVWNEAQGRFLPLPTRFEIIDGQNRAIILNRSNSIYTVLQTSKSFSDIKGHWAQADIELLAAKMVISGKNENSYEPYSNITRAEFAALLVRALGLEEGVLKPGQFKDIDSKAWYAGSIAAATNENIIKGYDGNLFKPDNNISREEMAAMIARAARVAGKAKTITTSEQEQQLAKFKDQAKISSWAARDVALAVRTGIIQGMPGEEFAPQSNADRAQSAAILKRFLSSINFISSK